MTAPKRICKIEYGLLSPKEIRQMSARRIIWADTYDDNGYPIEQGLMDLHLGAIDPGLRCKTCDQKVGECPGHFGHIELFKPVIHVGFAHFIEGLLIKTCRSCGRLLSFPGEIEKFNDEIVSSQINQYEKDNSGHSTRLIRDLFYWTCRKCGRLLLNNTLDELDELSDALDAVYSRTATKSTYDIFKRYNLLYGAKCRFCGELQYKRECIDLSTFIETDTVNNQEHRFSLDELNNLCIKITLDDLNQLKIKYDDILFALNQIPESREKRKILLLDTEKNCPHCGEQQLKINFEEPTTFSEIWTENGKRMEHKLTPGDVRARLEKIPDEDLRLLGINPDQIRPEWTIFTVLPVPPVTMRPSIILETGQRSEDDLTHKLVDIILINQRFREDQDAGASLHVFEDLWELLQYHVTTYFDNNAVGCPPAMHRSGRPLITIFERIVGPQSTINKIISGKIQNFSACSIVTPDPKIKISSIGVPLEIANKLTIPEKVTHQNIGMMKKYILKGPDRLNITSQCGAIYVIRPNNKRIILMRSNLKSVAELIEPGWTVERQLKDGDIIFVNHKPTNHGTAIIAQKAKLTNFRTFSLNPAASRLLQVQFEGDSLTIYVPRGEESKAEGIILLNIENNLLSSRFGGPLIGAYDEILSGIFSLTYREKWFSKSKTLELLKLCDIERLPKNTKDENNVKNWSNKQIFSHILPNKLNVTLHAKFCRKCEVCKKGQCDHDAFVQIIDGKLQSGTIDENAIGVFNGILINRIIRQYGMRRGAKFVEDLFNLAIRMTMHEGMSSIIEENITSISKSVKKAHSADYTIGLSPSEFFLDARNARKHEVLRHHFSIQNHIMTRRLKRGLENLTVHSDGSVRTANGTIVQFRYGDDGTAPRSSCFGDAVDIKGIIESTITEESLPDLVNDSKIDTFSLSTENISISTSHQTINNYQSKSIREEKIKRIWKIIEKHLINL